MDDNVGKYYIDNGVLMKATGTIKLGPNDGVMIYDVIRIIDGIPLFFEDHYERTRKSFLAIGNTCSIEPSDMQRQIDEIIQMNNCTNCNIKFILFTSGSIPRTVGYISKSYYPDIEEIKKGVAVGLFLLERENPNIKLIDYDYKKKINDIKKENGFYEVFLVDKEGSVNEGGTSNIFFVKEGRIFTAPDEKVLKGITRKRVIESCKEWGIEVVEEPIPVDSIWNSDAVFLSGTSPKVLPVSSIDDIKFDSANHRIVEEIRKAFDEKINKYLIEKKELMNG